MQIGIVGLGRMGMNMAKRLLRGEHQVVAYNQQKHATKEEEEEEPEPCQVCISMHVTRRVDYDQETDAGYNVDDKYSDRIH